MKRNADTVGRYLLDLKHQIPLSISIVYTRVIYDRVRNRKNYFEIATFLNFERGTSRVGNSNENKNTNNFEFSCSWYSSFNWRKGGNFKIIFPLPYPIIYNPGLYNYYYKMTFDRFCFFPSSSCSFSRVKTLHATVEQRSQLHQTLGLKFKDENVIF